MIYRITPPESVDVTLKLPASKSISNRALIINALINSDLSPSNLSTCDDTKVIVEALRNMPHEIDVMASGTAMRFLTAYIASLPDGAEHIVTGTSRMKKRPIGILVDALRHLGADVSYAGEEGFPPLLIRGKALEGGVVDIDSNVSSQYISALLIIAPMLKNGLILHLKGEIVSRPYIDLTVCMMKDFGADVDWVDSNTIRVMPKAYEKRDFEIENDWSAASYWYEILLLMSQKNADSSNLNIRLSGFIDGSRQGDSVIKYMFSMLGVKTVFAMREHLLPTTVTLKVRNAHLPCFNFDFRNHPDLSLTLVVTTALLGIPFRFNGLETLRIKETDRIAALKTEMLKLGYVLSDAVEGTLEWDGTRIAPQPEPIIDTYDDHRMAMAFAPAAILFPGLRIANPEVVTKSYPTFWTDLMTAGFKVEEQ